jgi:hypothetical protein
MLLARCFGEAVANGKDALADDLTGIVVVLKDIGQMVPVGLKALLDEMDMGELSRIETRREGPADWDLEGVVEDLIELLREFGLWPPPRATNHEPALPYVFGVACVPRRPSFRSSSGAHVPEASRTMRARSRALRTPL